MTTFTCDRCKRPSPTRNMILVVSVETKNTPVWDLCLPCVDDLTEWVLKGAEQRELK